MSNKEEILLQARNRIEDALEKSGPYSHNVIGLTLQKVANKMGKEFANQLIEEFDLEDYGFNRE